MSDRNYLSIGEVLAHLLEEFPDVTISKIRFLESQGLIDPERTPAGYRKFTEAEVERLRFILREQRTNYLPLRIIKNRLEDESADISRDFTLPNQVVSTSGHPAARGSVPRPKEDVVPQDSGLHSAEPQQDPMVPQSVQRDQRREAMVHRDNTESIPRDQLVQQHNIDPVFLKELEAAGLISGHQVGDTTFFDAACIEVAKAASRFQELGIEVRHLRAWKTSADREVNLYEQRILPLLRQRNPASREEALNMLNEFSNLGSDLRAALILRDIIRITEQR